MKTVSTSAAARSSPPAAARRHRAAGGRAQPPGAPIRIGSTLALTGPLVGDGADPQAGRRDLRRAAQQARRPARPPGRVDRQGRPVEARPGAHALRAARHRRQGRPADGPVRDRRDPLGDGRGAALQQGAGAPHASASRRWPSTTCSSRPGRSAPTRRRRCPTRCSTRSPPRPKPPKTVAVVTSKFPSIHFMSLGAREVMKKRGLTGGAVPRVGLRQPRLRPDRQPREGRQARLRLGRRDRPRRQPAARRDEEDRLRAAACTSTCTRRRARWCTRRRRRTRSSVTIFEEQPPFTSTTRAPPSS